MNKLKAHIQNIKSHGNLSEVTLLLESGLPLKALVIDTPETANYLKQGKQVHALFKETAVIISTMAAATISIENIIPCKVKSLEHGHILSALVMENEAGTIEAILPSSTTNHLKLEQGLRINVLVKSNEIMLSAV